jgi:hypothetical protein
MDALSDVLRVVQLTGAIYLRGAFSAPWSVISYADLAFCSACLPPTERVVSFHLVTEGSCWVHLPDEPGAALHVDAGDVIVVPRGETHVLCSGVELPPNRWRHCSAPASNGARPDGGGRVRRRRAR